MESIERYEKEIEYLKTHLIRRSTQSMMDNYDRICAQYHLANQVIDDEEKHRSFFEKLQDEFQHVDALVLQANTIAHEMQKPVLYQTIVHIPVTYLKSNERVRIEFGFCLVSNERFFLIVKDIAYLCQVAVQVKQSNMPACIWDMKKFELKFSDMRDLYQRWKVSEILVS